LFKRKMFGLKYSSRRFYFRRSPDIKTICTKESTRKEKKGRRKVENCFNKKRARLTMISPPKKSEEPGRRPVSETAQFHRATKTINPEWQQEEKKGGRAGSQRIEVKKVQAWKEKKGDRLVAAIKRNGEKIG